MQVTFWLLYYYAIKKRRLHGKCILGRCVVSEQNIMMKIAVLFMPDTIPEARRLSRKFNLSISYLFMHETRAMTLQPFSMTSETGNAYHTQERTTQELLFKKVDKANQICIFSWILHKKIKSQKGGGVLSVSWLVSGGIFNLSRLFSRKVSGDVK